MSKVLYIDASAGISGDMTVGALLDLGADYDALTEVFASSGIKGFILKKSIVNKGDTRCTDFDVILDKGIDNHDHDMDYLYGHERDGDFEVITDLTKEDEHDHSHSHHKSHDHADIPERSLSDVTVIIESCRLSDRAKKIAVDTFTVLAEAEAKVHGKAIDEVHFHEVGALDSIADIVSAAFCIDNLGIEDVLITHLTDGHGSVRCRHGIIPVPVPAVSEITSANNILLEISDIKGEMVTPTGAAFAAAVRTMSDMPESYRVIKSGHGAGKRDYETRGYLTAHIIEVDRQ